MFINDNQKNQQRRNKDEAWLITYGDIVTLMLTFFILLMNPENPINSQRVELIVQAFQGLGILKGGNTLEKGILSELGNNVSALPSKNRGLLMEESLKKAISEFQPEIENRFVKIKEDERGLVITLAGDILFEPGSTEINLEEVRGTLRKVAGFVESDGLAHRKIRIEGHSDSLPTDPNGAWPTNWELSTDRAASVLHYLVDYGANEDRFQVAGFADTVKLRNPELTESDRAENRRVDIVILKEIRE